MFLSWACTLTIGRLCAGSGKTVVFMVYPAFKFVRRGQRDHSAGRTFGPLPGLVALVVRWPFAHAGRFEGVSRQQRAMEARLAFHNGVLTGHCRGSSCAPSLRTFRSE